MQREHAAREYRLSITPRFYETSQRWKTEFLLETTRQFASFQYELGVREMVQGKTLRFAVTGLKTPQFSFPTNGPAQFRREYDNLRGAYEIVIEGLDHRANAFTVEIQEQAVRLVLEPADSFVELFTASPSTTR